MEAGVLSLDREKVARLRHELSNTNREVQTTYERVLKSKEALRAERLRAIRLRYEARQWRRRRVGPVWCMSTDLGDETINRIGTRAASDPTILEEAMIEIGNLQKALENRDVIGQAKGILMERFKIDADSAFDRLRVASQRVNREARDLAEDLARTGQWPPA